MEVNDILTLLKLNYAASYSSTEWIISLLKKLEKPSDIFKENCIKEISETELFADRLKKFLSIAMRFDSEKEYTECLSMGVKLYTYFDDEYPEKLKNISNPPLVLYVLGEIPDEPSISIVGTRKPTDYGKEYAAEFSYALSKMGICIVSGLARGIDTYVHRNVIKAGGKTIAVIGSGLKKIYPPENKQLVYKIVEKEGCVISEYSLNESPLKQNFPKRNRIISGLSFLTLVVEGDYSSGALITARYALEQGREVGAIPGRIDSPLSNGPNKLIKEGAHLIRNVKDIVDLIPPSELFGVDISKIYDKKSKDLNVNEKSEQIFNFIKEKKEVSVDEILENFDMKIDEVFVYLFELESNQLITLLGGKYRVNDEVFL
jgi:DNA processing protein